MRTKTVLITGVNGYLGAHLAKYLSERGYTVHGVDFGVGNVNIDKVKPYLSDYQHINYTKAGFRAPYDAVIHLAAYVSVGDSMFSPALYYYNNAVGVLDLITSKGLSDHTENIIFASTGQASDPGNPYALSKWMAENYIRDVWYGDQNRTGSIFRFYNLAGSDGKFGQIGTATHLIRIAAECAVGARDDMKIFGDGYDTPDGTQLRDYIHVLDVCYALEKAINKPAHIEYPDKPALSLGSGKLHSVIDVLSTMGAVTGDPIIFKYADPRPGDPVSIGLTEKPDHIYLPEKMGTLEEMCMSAYIYESDKTQ